MSILKLVVILAVAAGGYNYWTGQNAGGGGTALDTGAPGHFVSVPPVQDVAPGSVVVVAAENCTRDEAKKADQLVAELSKKGIPVVRTNTVAAMMTDPQQAANMNALMSSRPPIVFVGNRAKANPSLNEIVAEYSADKR